MKKIITLYFVFTLVLTGASKAFASSTDFYSEIYVLINRDTHEIIASKDKDRAFAPASLTKIMTTWLAIEMLEGEDLETEYTLPYEVFFDLVMLDASVAGFHEQESVKLIDILYGIMLPSGADATRAIAFYLTGSEEAFVEKMNEKAAQLNLKSTHFENTSGLDQTNHLSSAHDLSIILDNALKNPLFKEIFEARSYQTSPTNYTDEGYVWVDKNLEYADTHSSVMLSGAKSGYTELAGSALASTASVDNSDYILITSRAPYSPFEFYNVQDAISFYSNIDSLPSPDETAVVPETSKDTQLTPIRQQHRNVPLQWFLTIVAIVAGLSTIHYMIQKQRRIYLKKKRAQRLRQQQHYRKKTSL